MCDVEKARGVAQRSRRDELTRCADARWTSSTGGTQSRDSSSGKLLRRTAGLLGDEWREVKQEKQTRKRATTTDESEYTKLQLDTARN